MIHVRFYDKYLPERMQTRRRVKRLRLAQMSRGRRIVRRIVISTTWLLSMLTALVVVAVVGFYAVTDVPRPEDLRPQQVATIQYADGTTLARVIDADGGQNRTLVPLSKVPETMRWAVLAAEDRNFYHEPGVSFTGIARAVLNNVTGGDAQGGSGITQQYVKNAYLNSERTLTRKLKEIAIATKLARDYSKDQVLEFYLNTVYFGRGAYGIQAGAQAFFKVNVDQLTTAQGALLAGLLKAPTYYDPANDAAEAQVRWKYVIDGMVTTGHLSQADAATITFPQTAPPHSAGIGVSGWQGIIRDQVLAELKAHGISGDQVYTRGMTIRTTIDRKAQTAAGDAITATFAHLTAQQQNMKKALVAVDPQSGGVLAYYGGPNGTDANGQENDFDYAGVGLRPPGSSFKPYVLATALQQNLDSKTDTPLAINSLVDGSSPQTIEGTTIYNDPGDASVSTKSVSVANSMKYSLNTVFDRMAAETGPSHVADLAHAAGITAPLTDDNGKVTFGIGIGDKAIHPLDQAVGYATFANGGKANHAYFVSSATDSSGNLVYSYNGTSTQAFDPKVANDVTLTLEPIAAYSHFGLASNRPNAAKTGTVGNNTGRNKGDNSDAWTVGFTPQVSAAVWVGSGDSTSIFNSSGNPEYGSDLPGKTWKAFMDSYLKDKPKLPLPNKQQITTKSGRSGPQLGVTPSPEPTAVPQSTASGSIPTPTPASPTSTPTPLPTQAPTPIPTLGVGTPPGLPTP